MNVPDDATRTKAHVLPFAVFMVFLVGSVLASSVNGGLQLSLLANNNQGATSQFIGRGGIIQQANISGTVNQVRNLTSLTVALRETSRPPLNCSLAQLAIAPRAGY